MNDSPSPPSHSRAFLGFLFLIAIVSLGHASLFARAAQAPPEVVGFWRMIGAALILFPFALRYANVNRKQILLSFIAGFFFFIHLWTFIFAAQHTKIANCVVLFAVNPVFTSIGHWFLDGVRPRWKTLFAYAAAGAGVLIALHNKTSFAAFPLQGDLLAVVSAGFFSAFILTGNAARKNLNNLVFSPIVYFSAAVCFLVCAVLRSIPLLPWPLESWAAILGYILVPTLLGHTLYTYLLSHVRIHVMSFGKMIEPLVAIVSAWFLFSEKPGEEILLSFVFTAVATLLILWPDQNDPRRV